MVGSDGHTNAQELIVELADGPLGRVWLGRGLAGEEAGRLISVRLTAWKDVSAADKRELATGIAVAQRLRHARIAKTLTACVDGDQLLILGEYIEGEHLSSLRSVLARRGAPLSPPVATRIVLEALRSGDAAAQQLRALGDTTERRCLFPDTVLLTSYGQVLVSDVAVADALLRIHAAELEGRGLAYAPYASATGAAQADVLTAGVMLWELLTNRTASTGGRLPIEHIPRLDTGSGQGNAALGAVALRKVTDTMTRALEADPNKRYATLADMALALAALPAEWLASDERVREELRSVARGRFAARQRLLGVERTSLASEGSLLAINGIELRESDSAALAVVCDFDAPTRNALRPALERLSLRPSDAKETALVPAASVAEMTAPPRAFSLPLVAEAHLLEAARHTARGRRTWTWVAAASGVLAGAALVASWRAPEDLTAEPAHAQNWRAESESKVSPVAATQPAPAAGDLPKRSETLPAPKPASSLNINHAPKPPVSAAPSVSAAPQLPVAAPASSNSGAASTGSRPPESPGYRPSSIAPYRPRGI